MSKAKQTKVFDVKETLDPRFEVDDREYDDRLNRILEIM